MVDEAPDAGILAAQRIEVIEKVFTGWSSGDPDGPRDNFHSEAVLWDNANGEFSGWEEIREFFSKGLARYPDLKLAPTGQYWVRDDSIVVTWVMSATPAGEPLTNDDNGKWRVPGVSIIYFDGLKVVREEDYHDKASQQRVASEDEMRKS